MRPFLIKGTGLPSVYVTNLVTKSWLRGPADLAAAQYMLGSVKIHEVAPSQLGGFGPIIGQVPPGVDGYGEPLPKA